MLRARLLLLALPLYFVPSASADEECPLPLPGEPAGPVIFTKEQESILGEVVSEYLLRHFMVIEDVELNAPLRRIADRLLAHAPESSLEFEFFLADLPVVNAFALPGGRIFVSRKLLALVRDDDELAGVLAHEIGHVLTRDHAVELSHRYRTILGITEVGDREEIYETFHLLIENAHASQRVSHRGRAEQREQLRADRIGQYLAATAGYRPEAYARFWDRIAHTEGRTGNWLSDFFGHTPPESRRLREMLRTAESLPERCRGPRADFDAVAFDSWRARVLEFSGWGRKESLPGLVARRSLEPPLRDDVTHLRFSPDGRYLLAQDSSSIHVLSRDPFQPLFRIDAPNARPAEFSPDSRTLVFWTPSLRIEQWDVQGQEQVGIRELAPRKECLQSLVSSDARTFACFDNDFGVLLIDVESGEEIYEQRRLVFADILVLLRMTAVALVQGVDAQIIQMRFSPDGRYFVAAYDDVTFAFDLVERQRVSLARPVRRVLGGGFTFVTADRILGVNHRNPERSALVGFPDGPEIERHALGRHRTDTASNTDYVLLRPIAEYPLGIYDWKEKRLVGASGKRVFDVHGNSFVHETDSGHLGLYRMGEGELIAASELPLSPLGGLQVSAASPELDRIALAARSRGAVWDVESGRQIYLLRGFGGAHFADDGMLYVDIPESGEHPRRMVQLHLDRLQIDEAYAIEEQRAWQLGGLLISVLPQAGDGDPQENALLEVASSIGGAELWKRHFPREAPRVMADDAGGTIILLWRASSRAAQEEVAKFPHLAQRHRGRRQRDEDYYVEVVEGATGESRGAVVIETGRGSFRIVRANADGDWLLVSDSENRVLLYSISTGELRGRLFGRFAELAADAGILVLENELGRLTRYDLRTMRPLERLTFSSPVSFVQFAPDRKTMLVLTADQTVYKFDGVKAAAAASEGLSPD